MKTFSCKLLYLLILVLFFAGMSSSQSVPSNQTSIYKTCGETIRDSFGFILSPNYPNHYEPNTVCEYRILTEEGRNLELSFVVFDVEKTGNCRYDRVEVYNGMSSSNLKLGSYCGSFRPANVISTTNEMLIRFTSDSSRQGYGFMANFKSIAPQLAEPESCGGILLGEQGNFHSVNFPKSDYPNNMACVWHIKAPMNREVTLRFGKFHLESSPGCAYDFVAVYGQEYGSSAIDFLGKFCKLAQIPDEITTSGNQMYVTFASDSSGSDVGFSASFSSRVRDLDSISRGIENVETRLGTILTKLPTTTTTLPPPPTTTTKAATTTTTTRPPPTTTTAPTTAAPSEEGACPTVCPEVAEASGCDFYALSGKIGRVRQQREGEPLVVLVVVQKVFRTPRSFRVKRKSRVTVTIDCPRCYSSLTARSKILITGGHDNIIDLHNLANPDRLIAYSKKENKKMKRRASACRRSSGGRRRRKRNRNKRRRNTE